MCFFSLAGVSTSIAAQPPGAVNSNLISIAEFENKLSGERLTVDAVRLEGFVRAVVPERSIVGIQDRSGSLLLELPSLTNNIHIGDWLAIEGERCLLTRTRFGIRLDAVPVVNNNGTHSPLKKSGKVSLHAGMNQIRLEWFNGPAESLLSLEYEGPGGLRQTVPNSILWHYPVGKTDPSDLTPGLRFQAYEGSGWVVLPDFTDLIPVAEGEATNFSVAYRTREEYCGLNFNGFIQIDTPGLFTFYLSSDDGSRLYVGSPSVSAEILQPRASSISAPESFERALADRGNHSWIELEGEVAFLSQNVRSLEIEMLVGGRRVPVTVIEGLDLFATSLLHQWIRVEGICKFAGTPDDKTLAGVFAPGSQEVQLINSASGVSNSSSKEMLKTAAQVRRLKPEEARKHLAAKIRGVVIYATATAVVLQDASGGVFVSSRGRGWARQPNLRELWEIEGTTDPGDFSPVILASRSKFLGYAPLPEPIRPIRDQLMNGNLDAEYVELRGVLTAASDTELALLTSEGKVTVFGDRSRPLPELPPLASGGGSLVGSVIRIRGCVATLVDLQTRQVTPGKIYLYPAQVEVEDRPPPDPFLLPTRKASDLMWFDARASALQRTKLAGQIIYALPGEYFIRDTGAGFRVLATSAPTLKTGDLVEAVGFPKLGGSSPLLQVAGIRKTGHAPLPDPVNIEPGRLLDSSLDSTLVQVEATLISDTVHQEETVLELQSGPQHFVARLKSGARARTLLPPGCQLQLTGVYASADESHPRSGASLAPFELLLNDTADIVVLQQPSWWTLKRAVTVMSALASVLCVTFIWVALLRRKVEERTAQLKKEIGDRQLVEQRHAIEQERSRVAQDLHDELGAGLTEVSILGSLANTAAVASEAKERYLNQLTQMARSLVTSLDEIVWAINPQYDSAASLTTYFSLFAESFLNLAGIVCRFRVAENIPDYPLDSKTRHGVFCAYKEALNNVIRHSGATEVQLVFDVIGNQLVLSVIDNGRGFELAGETPGQDGLAGLKQRMTKLGGDCEINSRPGHGTKVEIRLPLKQA